MTLSEEQLERYSRQMLLSDFGGVGQEKLLNSKVLVVGAGGLGSAVIYYLASSGVGNLGIVDFDKVELSNLHRQIVHGEKDLGKSKAKSAKEKINSINNDVKVVTYEKKLTRNNIEEIFNEYEIIVDGLDTFKDKFLVNDYAVKLNKKLVHAGAVGYEGQILTILNGSADLRKLFPEGIEDSEFNNCKSFGILPTCVALISVLQANEVLKLILGIGEPMSNRILKINALQSSFKEVDIKSLVN